MREDNNINLPTTISQEIDTSQLKQEAYDIINQLISETDVVKQKDLTYLFNQNQNKKTLTRVNKLSELLDVITDQALTRFSNRPDEISNKELLDGLKVVQDMIDRSQRQSTEAAEQAPLIQINQQNNSLQIGEETTALDKASRDRVKNAVLGLLNNIGVTKSSTQPATSMDIEDKTDE